MKKLEGDLPEFFPKSGGSVSKILQMKWEYTARPGGFPEGEGSGGQGDRNPFHEHLVCHTLHFGTLTSTRSPDHSKWPHLLLSMRLSREGLGRTSL